MISELPNLLTGAAMTVVGSNEPGDIMESRPDDDDGRSVFVVYHLRCSARFDHENLGMKIWE